MANKRKLRVYKNGTDVWTLDDEKEPAYPLLRCPKNGKDCSPVCALFNMSDKYKFGQKIFCGKTQIGVLG